MAASGSFAAIQGERDPDSSTAITTISLNIGANIQITNVDDISLQVDNRYQDFEYEERVCIRGNVGSRFSVTAAGQDGSQNPFRLYTETEHAIEFEVYFRGDLKQPNTDQLYPGQPSPFYVMQTQVQNCDGDDTASFTILFKSQSLVDAAPGIYSGFLTLTVAAE